MKKGIIKKFTSRLGKIGLSFLMIFTTLNLSGISNTFAVDADNINDYPEKIKVVYNGKITWSGNIVGDFKLNGRQAFCMAHPKPTPGNGVELSMDIYDNDNVRKVLYYGWEGPQQWSGFTSRAKGVVVTSLALSYYYYGDKSTNDIDEFLAYIKNKTVPEFDVNFNKSKVQAYKEGNIQKTETIELSSKSNLFGVTIKLLDQMTYVDETHNTRQTGGSVTIKGQTRFHFEAPLNVNLDTWKSGNKTARFAYQPIRGQAVNSSYQPVGQAKYVFDPDDTTSLQVDWLTMGNLKILKEDNKGNKVPNVQFKVSYNSDMSSPIGTYTTGNDGSITVNDLNPQTVYIQETSVADNLILDNTIHSIDVKTGETVTFTQINDWKQGYIRVVKKDKETGKVVKKAGTVFDIYNSSNTKITSITTNENGIATSGLLDYGNYTVKESQAPNGFTINVELNEKVGVVENGHTYEISVSNQAVKGTLNISKEDTKTGKQPQGEATLEGARYGLYARNPIVDPADGTVIYNTDVKVAELVTNSEANASISNLYLGEYYIKEIEPSYGYNLDTTKYNFDLTYQNQNVDVVTKNLTVYERVISQAFSIIKVSSDKPGEADLLEGAEFTVKAQKDIDKFGSWEAAPIAKNANGEETKILVTDKKGYAESERLPIGSYVVRETKTPTDKYKVEDFTITITEDSSEPQVWRVFNDTTFMSVIAIVKQDAETGKTVKVEGAEFKIKNLDTNKYVGYWEWFPLPHYVDSWTTDESGTVMTGEKLRPGNYQLEEVQSPNGYLLSEEPVKFVIHMNDPHETLPDGVTPVITVKKQDIAVQGQISVEKKGEVLVGFNEKTGKFIYEQRGLADAKYNVVAKEDILDPSNDGTVLFKKGTVVETLVTGNDGKATTKKLPLGKYEVVEVEAPSGMVLNKNSQTVELKYKDQYTAIVMNSSSFVNERQKVEAKVIKVDSEQSTIGLSGGEFNFVAKEDIRNADGTVIVKANSVISKFISDSNGEINLNDMDLPLNYNFEMVETKAPIGYVLDETPVQINTDYQGQNVEKIVISKTKTNKATEVDFSKTDVTTNKELPGNHLTVFEKDNEGSSFETWISGDKPHTVKNLSTDTRYILRETSSVKGFYIANNIEFEIDQKGNVYVYEDGNKVLAKDHLIVMKNDLVKGRLEWNKTGEIFTHTDTGQNEFGKVETPVWEQSNLLQAEISIYAAEDIKLGNDVTYYKADEKVQTLESDWNSVQSKNLLVGRYYYVESKTPHGYVINTDKHYFEVKDNQSSELQIIKSTLKNDRPTVEIEFTKFMETFKHHNKMDNSYKDVVFGIYAREDIYNYMGEVAIENGTLIATSGIDELGQLTTNVDLPNGVYYLKELQTNEDYVLDTNEYDFEIAYHGQDVSRYVIKIGENGSIENKLIRGSIEIKKNDSFDETKKLSDVEFNISANKNMSDVISTAKTDESGTARFNDMEIGKYYIQEAKQVNGYTINDHIYEVEITTNGEVLTVDVDNKPTEMIFSKVDETGVKELPGAEIEIIDKETNEVIDKWVSTEESHQIKYLVEGKEYIMREVTSPNGYYKAEEITFVAKDGQKVTMKDELILTDIQVNKVDSVSKEAIKSLDFEFTMYSDSECTKPIMVANANKEDGYALFKDIPYSTVYIKETKAPKGYQLSNEVKKIVIDDNLENVGKTYNFVYENMLLPSVVVKTSDDMPITVLTSMTAIAGICIFLSYRRKKKELYKK